ncbi:MAG: cysteine desulfurase family protein [bacterium]
MRKIYLDNSATTPVDKRVLSAMSKYWSNVFGNPSSIHSIGVEAKIALQYARKTIADLIGGHDREIVFTSGGTEANNLAIFGLINSVRKEGRKYSDIHLITTEIEHSSIYECLKEIESRGSKIDYLKVDEFGMINPRDLRKMIKPETLLVSIGYANSEIGVIQPIKEIIKEIRHCRKEFSRAVLGGGRERVSMPYLHTDASQAGLYLNMNVEELGVDLMTLDAQKMYGPKGIGALFVRDGIKIEPMMFGGGQEKGRRSGTENIPLIVGFTKAFELARKVKNKENKRLIKIRNEFFDSVKKFVPNVIINGHLEARLPSNINISVPGQDGEMLVFRLDEAGIIGSSSSACSSGNGESVVVRKIAEKTNASEKEVNDRAKSVLRFSMGKDTKIQDIKKLLNFFKNL